MKYSIADRETDRRDYITNGTVWFRNRTICPNIWCLPSSNCCQNPTKLEYFAGVVCKCFKFNYTFDGWIRDEILNEKSTNSHSGSGRESPDWIKFDFAYDVRKKVFDSETRSILRFSSSHYQISNDPFYRGLIDRFPRWSRLNTASIMFPYSKSILYYVAYVNYKLSTF